MLHFDEFFHGFQSLIPILLIFQSEKSGKKAELATVIAPYTATSKEQLTLQKGQMIVVRKKTDTGWWQGEMSATGTVSVKMTEFYENSVKSFHDFFFRFREP